MNGSLTKRTLHYSPTYTFTKRTLDVLMFLRWFPAWFQLMRKTTHPTTFFYYTEYTMGISNVYDRLDFHSVALSEFVMANENWIFSLVHVYVSFNELKVQLYFSCAHNRNEFYDIFSSNSKMKQQQETDNEGSKCDDASFSRTNNKCTSSGVKTFGDPSPV